MKKILAISLVFVLAISLLTACKITIGGGDGGGSELVGVWARVTEDGKIAEVYEFIADGTVKLWSWWVGVMEATYKIDGDKLTLSHDEMGDATQRFKVNGNTLTLTDNDGSVTELTRNDDAWDNINNSDEDWDGDWGNDSNAADDTVYMKETEAITLDSLRKAAESEGVKPEKYEASSFDKPEPAGGFKFEYEYTAGYGGGTLNMTILEFKNENEVRDYINYQGSFYVYLAAGKYTAVIMGNEVVGMKLAQRIFVNAGADPGDVQIGGSNELNALKKAAGELGCEVDDYYYVSSFAPVKPADGFCFAYTYTTDTGGGMGDINFYEFKNEDGAKEYAEELSAGFDYWVVRGKFVAKTSLDHDSALKMINDIFDKAGIK